MCEIVSPIILVDLKQHGLHILIELFISGYKQLAILDTGASKSVFDTSVLTIVDPSVTLSGNIPTTTLFSTTGAVQIMIPEIRIGELLIRDYETLLMDLNEINRTYLSLTSQKVIGIIGGDIFYKYKATIDYQTLKVHFYD